MKRRFPVVMIHGAFCGAWAFANWRAFYEARGFSVETPNLRHHGSQQEAFRSLAGVGIGDYVSDLRGLIGRLDAAPVLIGHSLGGLVAQMLAARGGVRALVLLAPLAPSGIFPSTAFEWLALHALYWHGAFRKKVLPPHHSIAAAHAFDLVPEPERQRFLDRLVPESGRAIFEAMHWMLDSGQASFVDRLSVTCPILCISGARDRIVSPATVRRIARRYGGRARYEQLRDHGHWLPGEPGWERIAAGALTWLDQVLDNDSRRVSGAK